VLAQEAAGALAERAAAARGGAGGGAARGGPRCDEATLVVLDCSRSMAQAAFSDLPEAQRCMTAADLQVRGLLSSLDSHAITSQMTRARLRSRDTLTAVSVDRQAYTAVRVTNMALGCKALAGKDGKPSAALLKVGTARVY
jgi:hypothetical protein